MIEELPDKAMTEASPPTQDVEPPGAAFLEQAPGGEALRHDAPCSYADLDLLPDHEAMLKASGIAPDVARLRGYRSITTKAELQRLGFSANQRAMPTLLIPLHSANGEIGLYHHRPDMPRIVNAKVVKYEFPKGSRMVIDVHPRNREKVRDPKVPLFITEGAKKADAATSLGLCCIALIGTWNWRGTNEHGGKTALPDWEMIALKDGRDHPRRVYLCFDSDLMTKPQVYQALVRLAAFLRQRGATVLFIYLPHGEGGTKTGLDDYLAAGHTVDDLLALVSSELRGPVRVGSDGQTVDMMAGGGDGDFGDTADMTVSHKLLHLARNVELFHDERSRPFARLEVSGHKETWPLRSSSFKSWLKRAYYIAFDKAANAQAVEDALGVLEGKASFDGPETAMSVRCASNQTDGSIWLDLCDKDWRAVHISPSGWKIVGEPPPLFRRHVTHAPCLEPDPSARPEDIGLLRRFVNAKSEGSWRQLVAWIVASWLPAIGHPVLVVHGEQGTAKSTLVKLLVKLVDPSHTPLRSEPDDVKEWVQMADHSWMIALDNVSVLPKWLSDALCRAVTDDAYVKRMLFTDEDDIMMAFHRVIALTGITVVAQRPDLLDRSILLGLEPIPKSKRIPETRLMAEFEAIRPRLFGALLSLLQGVLGELPTIRTHTDELLPELPRMADFAEVGLAVERVLGWPSGSFMHAYGRGIEEQNEEALAGYPISEPLMALVVSEWRGTFQELLVELAKRVDEKVTKQQEWPKSARSLSVQLKRISPNLRAIGIEVKDAPRTGKARAIVITRQQPDTSVTTEIAQSVQDGQIGDANGAAVTQTGLRDANFSRPSDGKRVGDANDAKIPDLSLIEVVI